MGVKATKTAGRNDPCPCGSELKFKRCHGSQEKAQACNAVANMYMARLIAEERKNKGLDPYLYTCKDCGKGTDKPLIAEIAAPTPIQKCPFCEGTDLKKNEVKTKRKQELKPEKKSSIILKG